MRTTINIDDKIAGLGDKIAERDFRGNFSHLCEVALKEYCGPRIAEGPHAELIAAAEEVGIEQAVATLKRSARTRKTAA